LLILQTARETDALFHTSLETQKRDYMNGPEVQLKLTTLQILMSFNPIQS